MIREVTSWVCTVIFFISPDYYKLLPRVLKELDLSLLCLKIILTKFVPLKLKYLLFVTKLFYSNCKFWYNETFSE